MRGAVFGWRLEPDLSIVEEIKREGESAVRRWAVELDGAEPVRAVAEPGLLPREALLDLAGRVRRWHEAQRPADISLEIEPGVLLERHWLALDTVGVYVPRNLVSTLVMCAVPAQAAGVKNIVVCTPPAGAGLVAAAAEELGINEVWALGGPQAIGWLAYVRKVDKIVGPGNSYVNEAKLAVQRDVAIDLPGGPSEVVVIATGEFDQRIVELELAAQQAEHGEYAVRRVETLEEAEGSRPSTSSFSGRCRGARAPGAQCRRGLRRSLTPAVAAGDYATGGTYGAADPRLGAFGRKGLAPRRCSSSPSPPADHPGPHARRRDRRGTRRSRGDDRARGGGRATDTLSTELALTPGRAE